MLAANRPAPPKAPTSPRKKNQAKAPTGVALEQLAWGRLAYGPTGPELSEYRAGGKTEQACFDAFVEAQLHPEQVKDEACEKRLAALQLTTLTKTVEQLWKDHVVAVKEMREKDKETKPGDKKSEGDLHHQPLHETEVATWVRAVYSRRQLHEVLTEFWHNHFSIYAPDGNIAPVFAAYDRDAIRPHVLGNFHTMLSAVAQSPAMLLYLDNAVSQSGNPNENYARELFELHTLGAEHYLGTAERQTVPGYAAGAPIGYVDGDVYEAARCFTGWRLDTGNKSGETGAFQYFDGWHDRFQKIVLGKPIPEHQPPMADGLAVLERVATHPGTARHVALRLCRRLLCDEPRPQLIEQVAKVFLAKAGDKNQLRAVVLAIVNSDDFVTTPPAKFRRPYELTVATLRATGADVVPDEDFLRDTGRSGQRLFQWRTPDGYPDVRDRWAGTALMLERWRLINQLVNGNMPGAKFDVAKATPASVRSPQQLADYWLGKALGRSARHASATTHAALVNYFAQGRNPELALNNGQLKERLSAGVALALMSPEAQWR